MADESTHLVLAFFDSEDAADQAAAALKEWDQATEEIKLGNVGVLVKDAGGQVKEHKLGPRSGKKGAGIGLVLGVVAAPFTAGLSLLGGAAVGAVGGGLIGTLFHKGLPKEDVDRISAELEAGHAAVGALVEEGDAAQVTAQLAALGGHPEAHEVSDAGLQAVAATAAALAEPATPAAPAAAAAGATAPTATGSDTTDTTTAPPAAGRSGKFEIYQDAASKYRWRLKAINGQTIATGDQGYTTQAACETGISSVKANAPTAEFEVYQDTASEYRWRLKTADGQIIATGGQGYRTHANCENGIASVKTNAPAADVVVVAAV